ncbi:MAG: hypothetical protein IIW46_02460 [Bacteroidaceae bacterium]|nr:hypothetical protein [Bacteroidaceae bacterium]
MAPLAGVSVRQQAPVFYTTKSQLDFRLYAFSQLFIPIHVHLRAIHSKQKTKKRHSVAFLPLFVVTL